MAGSLLTFKRWKESNPEGTEKQYQQELGNHNFLHLEAARDGAPGCPFGSRCPGWALEPNWGLIRRTWDRLHGVEDPGGNYGV